MNDDPASRASPPRPVAVRPVVIGGRRRGIRETTYFLGN